MIQNIGVTQWFLDCPPGPISLYRAKELGFSYIHINAGCPQEPYFIGNSETVIKYQSAMSKCLITITAISINAFEKNNFLTNYETIDTTFAGIIREALQGAQALNVPVVYLPSFGYGEIKNLAQLKVTARILEYACDCAANLNITIATENTLSAVENRVLFQKVNRPNLKLLVDSQNPLLWNHAATDLIELFYSKMVDQVHIKDGINKTMGNARLGTGDGNLVQTLESLYSKGYDGLLILENDYSQNASIYVTEDLIRLNCILDTINMTPRHATN